MQTSTWILVADGARARIFETDPDDRRHLNEIHDFANPDAMSRDSDLETDNLGRFYGKGERDQAHTAQPQEDPVEHATRKFSKAVGEFLDRACAEHRYETLHLLAAPKFLGAIRQHLGKQTQQKLGKEIAKDVSGLNEREIEDYVERSLH